MLRVIPPACLLLAACSEPGTKATDDTDDIVVADTDVRVTERLPGFPLGVAGIVPGLGDTYATAGVTWARTRLEPFDWEAIEPDPPVGSVHTYDWACADAQIVGWQQAGVTNIQATLSPKSTWGSVFSFGRPQDDLTPKPDKFPAFRAWVRALIERYDGDGVDDAPGLVAPVRVWVVGPEWTDLWPGGEAEGYLLTAEAVAEEARAVYPEVLLGTIPLLFVDEFAGNEPSDRDIEDRMGPPFFQRNPSEGLYQILDRLELFDFIAVHAEGDHTEIPPLMRWMQAEMASRGHDMPVWLDEATPAGLLANNRRFPALYPVTDATQTAAFDVLRAAARGEDTTTPTGAEALAWVHGFYASNLVKKVLTSLGEGVQGIQLRGLEDLFDATDPALRESTVAIEGGAAMMGMTAVTHPDGRGACDARVPGAPRPALAALTTLTELLGDGDFDRVTALGGLQGPRGYALERGGATQWVLWHEDGLLHLPSGPAEVPVSYTLTVPAGVPSVQITPTPVDASDPVTTERLVVGGEVTLSLSSVPVFVTPTVP